MAKGYPKKYDIDYNKVFACAAIWDTIRTILVVSASQRWRVFQPDVKSAFLHDELVKVIYINQPTGYHKRKLEWFIN